MTKSRGTVTAALTQSFTVQFTPRLPIILHLFQVIPQKPQLYLISDVVSHRVTPK